MMSLRFFSALGDVYHTSYHGTSIKLQHERLNCFYVSEFHGFHGSVGNNGVVQLDAFIHSKSYT